MPNIENNNILIEQIQSIPKIWGIHPTLVQILLSIFVPLFLFGLTLGAQYITNRKREILRLYSFRNTLRYIVKDLIKFATSYQNIYREANENFIKITNFSTPSLSLVASKHHLIDTVDKKELLSLVNRWTRNEKFQTPNILKLFKISYNLDVLSNHIISLNKDIIAKETIVSREKWNSNSLDLQRIIYQMQADTKTFGLTDEQARYVLGLINDKRLQTGDFNLKLYLEIVITPILKNGQLSQAGFKSNSSSFSEFWSIVKNLWYIGNEFLHNKEQYTQVYANGSTAMEKAVKHLNRIDIVLRRMKFRKKYIICGKLK